MKNTIRLIGFAVIAAILGIVMLGCAEPDTKPKSGSRNTVINIAAIGGVTIPEMGEIPVTEITPTAQYTGTVTWSPDVSETFEAETVYTATITLTAKKGFTLQGVAADFFTVAGADYTGNEANSGVITADFPATGSTIPTTVTISSISGVIAPVTEEVPVTDNIDTAQFSGTVSWNGNPAIFASKTVYTAVITLTAKKGFKFDGVGENFFDVFGAETTTNNAHSNIVTAVFPATGGTQAEELVAKWYGTQAEANTGAGTGRYEFKDDGKILNNGADDNFTYTVDGNTITITHILGNIDTANFYIYGTTMTITNATGTFVTDGIYFKHSNTGAAIGGGDSDFTSGTLVTTFNVHNAVQWDAARAAISTGGENRKYIVNIIGNITVGGAETYTSGNPPTKSYYTFGTTENSDGVTVSIRGTGTLSVDESYGKDGALLTVREGQTLMLSGVTLQGHSTNNDSLVAVSGTFIMHSGKITGNTTNETDEYGNGGGVRVTRTPNAVFIMHAGEISGNTAVNGGGVGISEYGKFIMNGGVISGNFATENGGGVYNDASATFQISNGKIYGDDALPNEQNSAYGTGDSLHGSADLGTYNGSTFTPNTSGTITIDTSDETIWVVNGKRMYSDIGHPPHALLENVWYTSQYNADRLIGDTIEFIDNGRILENGEYAGLTYNVSGSLLTVYKAGAQEGRHFSISAAGENGAGLKMTISGSGAFLAHEYFIPDPDYIPTFDITSESEWINALNYANGKKGKLNFNIMNDFSAPGTTTSITAAASETLQITIKGIGAVRTVTLSSNGSLIRTGSRVTLTLEENLIVQGRTATNNLTSTTVSDKTTVNTYALIHLEGTLIMNESVKITGNSNTVNIAASYFNHGAGVRVIGTFTMNGGEISGNTATVNNSAGLEIQGGGVYVSGTFNMNDGKIYDNGIYLNYTTTYSIYGGGVYVSGTFNMNDGKIYNNTANNNSTYIAFNDSFGGGVYVDGNFNMSNGEIYGNAARTTSSNATYSETTSRGGGVYMTGGTFIMTGGEIYGNTASATGGKTNISQGGGIYWYSGTSYITKGVIYGNSEADADLRNIAASGGASLYITSIFGTATSYPGGIATNLSTTNDTIRVDGMPPLVADPVTSTPLAANVWLDGTIGVGEIIWYSIPVTQGTRYYIWWDDRYNGHGAKTCDVSVGAKYANGDVIFGGTNFNWQTSTTVDSGYSTPQTFTAGANGTVYIRVREPSRSSSGTFGIVYNTTGVRPAL